MMRRHDHGGKRSMLSTALGGMLLAVDLTVVVAAVIAGEAAGRSQTSLSGGRPSPTSGRRALAPDHAFDQQERSCRTHL